MSEFKKVCSVKDIIPGKCKGVNLEGNDIGIYSIDGVLYAMEDVCPHQGAPLSQGTPRENIVMCPWHMWKFDIKTGKSLTAPGADLKTYEVQVEGDDVLVKI